ncbi:hypothetical protein [Nonomuraea pusilla]|uniref:Uncharacterized protein n=1 Tax=Nonomuraea pusilla TaxID=46177 RepID=A0A1H8FRN9_9ACTN|nr:hypothetical protein [Nonomuraea pusilla]SEN34215.1 hypothetical protein SAMN05660976_07321 [Nonomuraea pusilla]
MVVTQTSSAPGRPAAAVETGPRELSLDLPMISVRLRAPDIRLPRMSRQEMGHAADIARSFLPAPERLAYYGALGALAALGVLEWPVAAAIGAGTIIAQRGRTEEHPMGTLHHLRDLLPMRHHEEEPAAGTQPTAQEPAAATGRAATARRGAATAAKATTEKATTGKATTEKGAAGKGGAAKGAETKPGESKRGPAQSTARQKNTATRVRAGK